VQNRVDFSDPVNLNTAAVSMVVAIANYTLAWDGMTFEGIALGSVAAIGIYHAMRWISKVRGTNLEQASPASAPAGTELEGPAYSRRAAHAPSSVSPALGSTSSSTGNDGGTDDKKGV
jgi:NCS2 family nucleobase:cation symporter-2